MFFGNLSITTITSTRSFCMSKKLLLTAVLSGLMVSTVSLNAEGENPNSNDSQQPKTSWLSPKPVVDFVKSLSKRDAAVSVSTILACWALFKAKDVAFGENEEDEREFSFE